MWVFLIVIVNAAVCMHLYDVWSNRHSFATCLQASLQVFNSSSYKHTYILPSTQTHTLIFYDMWEIVANSDANTVAAETTRMCVASGLSVCVCVHIQRLILLSCMLEIKKKTKRIERDSEVQTKISNIFVHAFCLPDFLML